MKTVMYLFMSVAGLAAATPALAGDVTVDLSGVRPGKGDLYVGLQSQDQFLKDAGSYGTIVRAPKPGAQTIVVKDVAPGDWSVSVWHDSDGDGKFSRDARGVPTDGWSMPGAATMRGKPTWDMAKVAVPAGGIVLKLDMVYPR